MTGKGKHTGNHRPIMKAKAKGLAKAKGFAWRTKADRPIMKAAAAADVPLVKPISLVHRSPSASRAGEAYLMQGTLRERYICGISERNSLEYLATLEILKGLIEADGITTKEAAKTWLQESGGLIDASGTDAGRLDASGLAASG